MQWHVVRGVPRGTGLEQIEFRIVEPDFLHDFVAAFGDAHTGRVASVRACFGALACAVDIARRQTRFRTYTSSIFVASWWS